MSIEETKAEADKFYRHGNDLRKQQLWDQAIIAYEHAAELDPESPAVHARQMLLQIMEYRCKAMYNP
ncbi:MAG: tetratricopeptide repeat protein [Bacteroidaceae bacterium]|nr:tetratricopeptide repeat protein [Bacteroidaceae bacterium]